MMYRTTNKKDRLWPVLLGISVFLMLGLTVAAQQKNKTKRDQIGEVLGKPVFRDQFKTGNFISVESELHRLFATPLMDKYHKEHKKEITPTEKEINFVIEFFKKAHPEEIKDEEPELRAKLKVIEEKLKQKNLTQDEIKLFGYEKAIINLDLEPPGRNVALFMLNRWKFQKHLYDNYGEGRVLWQQAGYEAYDATHQWLKSIEKKGEFKISDAKLRLKFYEYWTNQKNSPFLLEDKEEIRTEFLEPEWIQKRVKK